MSISLNHTIVHTHDKAATAQFLTEILGLPPPQIFGHFSIVQIGETSLDLTETSEDITSRHFAFLVSEAEFDDIFARIKARKLAWWADPYHNEPNAINRRDGGRGLYFDDPNGHNLEILTRPYGSGGKHAVHSDPANTG